MDRVTEFLETEFPDAEERALLLAIVAAPSEITAKLVYADWLDERDDPRGEYVRLLVKQERKKPTPRMSALRKKCSGPWLSMLGELHARFSALTAEVEGRPGTARGWRPTVRTTFDRGLWDVRYSGNLAGGWEADYTRGVEANEALPPVLRVLSEPEIASVLRTVSLDDENCRSDRANGTLDITLFPPLTPNVVFPYLEGFSLQQGEGIILSDPQQIYEEAGQIAKLLTSCPRLSSLAVPSAPNSSFFEGRAHRLEVLDVHAGYDAQQFVRNLATSTRFQRLQVLRYKDFCCDYMAPEPHMFTPFKDWEAFFKSPVCRMLETVELSGVVLTGAEVRSLLKLRSKGVSITRSPSAP
jgi:uncharacterized protein (TIGR02996 family)